MTKKTRNKTIISLIVIVFCSLYLFIHSSPERVIRSSLFFQHYFVDSFKTHIVEDPIGFTNHSTRYYCVDPGIGPDRYNIEFKYIGKFKLYYIDWKHTGGG